MKARRIIIIALAAMALGFAEMAKADTVESADTVKLLYSRKVF